MSQEMYQAVGRRKTSIARVRLLSGEGKILINGKPIDNYFAKVLSLVNPVLQPLKLTKSLNKYDVFINVDGGGIAGQSQAIRHGIARALVLADSNLRLPLKKEGFLTRDPRMVERKKPGRPKARKRFQFSKR